VDAEERYSAPRAPARWISASPNCRASILLLQFNSRQGVRRGEFEGLPALAVTRRAKVWLTADFSEREQLRCIAIGEKSPPCGGLSPTEPVCCHDALLTF
jgi:hypothetical protein